MRTVNSILATIFALLIILFAVSNRTEVDISIWPFPFTATMGVYAVVLLAVLVGFLAGLIAAWFAGGGKRRERKRLRGQVKDLEQNLLRAQDTRPTV